LLKETAFFYNEWIHSSLYSAWQIVVNLLPCYVYHLFVVIEKVFASSKGVGVPFLFLVALDEYFSTV
jgi:hypothetical protein